MTIFSFLRHSVLDSGPGTPQTDRQTENGHQCIMQQTVEPDIIIIGIIILVEIIITSIIVVVVSK